MVKIVGVRFKPAGKIYYFDPADFDIELGSHVIVETARGLEYGMVVIGNREMKEEDVFTPLKPIIRIASTEDDRIYSENKEKTKEAFEICEKKAKEHGLDMYLIDCEYTFDRNKLIFYFTAEGRVDFRELVKDLATIFRTRIELRQIGVRDEAKILNSIGTCGRPLCCATWMGEFVPVSIKMAKEQSLSLNPAKISGVCGRLFCCLKYESEVYSEAIKKMPQVGWILRDNFTGKRCRVREVNLLAEQVKVEFEDNTIGMLSYGDYKVLKAVKSSKRHDEVLDKQTLEELRRLESEK